MHGKCTNPACNLIAGSRDFDELLVSGAEQRYRAIHDNHAEVAHEYPVVDKPTPDGDEDTYSWKRAVPLEYRKSFCCNGCMWNYVYPTTSYTTGESIPFGVDLLRVPHDQQFYDKFHSPECYSRNLKPDTYRSNNDPFYDGSVIPPPQVNSPDFWIGRYDHQAFYWVTGSDGVLNLQKVMANHVDVIRAHLLRSAALPCFGLGVCDAPIIQRWTGTSGETLPVRVRGTA